jgi:transcriptional regulator with XRE-family HTH domain
VAPVALGITRMGQRYVTGRAVRREDQFMVEFTIPSPTRPDFGEEFRVRNLPDLLRGARARAPVPPQFATETPDGGGLTQEQTARLVRLSERRYGAFERGAISNPKPQLVEHVAQVLQMTFAEREVLYQLALPHPADPVETTPDVRSLQSLVDGMPGVPALVTDLAWNALAWNRKLAEEVQDPAALPEQARNSILWMFSTLAPERIPEVRGEYAQLVGRVRFAYLTDGGRTRALQELVDRLMQIPEAERHWKASALAPDPLYQQRVLTRPATGAGLVRTYSVRFAEDGFRLIVSVPEPDPVTA